MTLQDNSAQAVIDYWQYQWIFPEAERDAQADNTAAENPSGSGGAQMPLTSARTPLKSFLPRKA